MSPETAPSAPADDLAARIRAALGAYPVREQPMFGSRCFLVDDRILVGARRDGDLLVRVPRDRQAKLLTSPGAAPAVMGQRTMGPDWLAVAAEHVRTPEQVAAWVEVALEARQTG